VVAVAVQLQESERDVESDPSSTEVVKLWVTEDSKESASVKPSSLRSATTSNSMVAVVSAKLRWRSGAESRAVPTGGLIPSRRLAV